MCIRDSISFDILQNKLKSCQRQANEISLFAGLIKCGECGHVNASNSPVIHQKHIQSLPPLQLFFCNQKTFFQLFRILLRSQGHQTSKRTGHQIGARDTAKKPVCGLPKFQRIKNIQQIFFQRIVLIYKRKSNQHITVNDSASIIDILSLIHI